MNKNKKINANDWQMWRARRLEFLFMINNHSYLVSKFQSSLRMQKDENASVIDINVEDEVPDRAIAFLDTLTHLYIDYSIAVSKEINSNTIKFVDDQLQDVEGILNGVESNLEQYQRQTGTARIGRRQVYHLFKHPRPEKRHRQAFGSRRNVVRTALRLRSLRHADA